MPDSFSPELFESKSEIRGVLREGSTSSNKIAQILKEDINFVGEGGRVVVAAIESDPDRLVAVSYKEMSPEEVKAIYYNQKILKILFPENFPIIYAGYGRKDGKGFSVTFRERVWGTKFTKTQVEMMMKRNAADSKTVDNGFDKVILACNEMNIPFYFDLNERNYMKSIDGDEVYVDTINFRFWTHEMKERVLEYMKKNTYPEKEIQLAAVYIDRLLTLNEKLETKKQVTP